MAATRAAGARPEEFARGQGIKLKTGVGDPDQHDAPSAALCTGTHSVRFFEVKVARLAGFEPTTPWFVARYSIQLSYSRPLSARS